MPDVIFNLRPYLQLLWNPVEEICCMIVNGLDDCIIYFIFCEWMVNSSSSYANKNLLNKNVDIKSSVHGDLTLTLLRKQLLLCHLNTACLSGKCYCNGKVGFPLTSLILPHFCACLGAWVSITKWWSFVVFNDLGLFGLFGIGRAVDH